MGGFVVSVKEAAGASMAVPLEQQVKVLGRVVAHWGRVQRTRPAIAMGEGRDGPCVPTQGPA